jgi:CRISPR-associated exonuclease Cas4
MNTAQSTDEYLMLSGIQHMAFCPRQWALIHIEQMWAENVRTVEGKYLHERADNPFGDAIRKDIKIVRSMPVVSHKLGLRGIIDVVEFHRVEEQRGITVQLQSRKGWWRPYLIEYKRGEPKRDDRDAVQLCAQAIALEEMMGITIELGYLFYGQTRRREEIDFNNELRNRVEELSAKMHLLFRDQATPKAIKMKHCVSCSLVELCQPNLSSINRSVKNYLTRMIEEEVIND